MLSQNQVKFIRSLQLKKFRVESGLFIAEGAKIVPEILNSSFKVKEVFATSAWLERNWKFESNTTLTEVSDKELEKISGMASPNQVIALVEIPNSQLQASDLKGNLTLALDTISDPGNMGTIIRLADWFGIKNVICSTDSVELYNPKVVQSTMGSITRVHVHYVQLHELVKQAKSAGVPVYGAVLNGKSLYSEKLNAEAILLMGNESHGISNDLLNEITNPITIPSYGEGIIDSLNVAIATSIICAEFRRQHA